MVISYFFLFAFTDVAFLVVRFGAFDDAEGFERELAFLTDRRAGFAFLLSIAAPPVVFVASGSEATPNAVVSIL